MVPGADPVLGNSQVYFCGDRRCVALDGGNGEIVWEQTDKVCHEKGIRSTPLVYGGNIYVGTYDGDLLAMSAETGIQLWRFDEAEWIGSSPDVYEAGHSIIIGLEHAHDTIKGSVIAIDISTGLRKWEVYVHHYVHSSPLIIDTHAKVIIGTNGGELLCIDAVSGERLWTHCCSGAIKSRASFDDKNNVIVCGSFNDQIIALDMCTGERLWTVKTAGIVYSEPCIVRDCVYVACADKFLYIIRLHTGEVVDKVFFGYRMLASPILVDEHIYVVTTNGRVVQVSTATGKITGQHNLSEQATSSLTYSPLHQLFYVATAPGALTALRLCSDLDV
jgi:outer membrane protein assembly factor BamB